MLRYTLPERRLHAVTSFSKAVGVGSKLAKQFLLDAQAIDASDQRPDSRQLFDAGSVVELEVLIPQLVGLKEMGLGMNATRSELFSLRDDGILPQRFPLLPLKNQWVIADGLAIVKELTKLASPVSIDELGWETIQAARRRKLILVANIIEAIRSRRLALGQRGGETGYHSFCVREDEINALATERVRTDPSSKQRKGKSLAAFGSDIGIREAGVL
ncbi:MAG: hypothetical protein JXQ89_12610 [Pelagimonas sp.]